MAPQMPKMPVPPMARPMAPQMSQPGGMPGMADGGLTTLPMDQDMFNYAPGGIVAFANEGLVGLPEDLANTIMREQLEGKVGLPMPVSREDERKRIALENPELGAMLNKVPGEALTRLISQLEQQGQQQRERFQEGEGSRGLAALSQALIAAGEATRGQKGMGLGAALGGFGKSYNAATAATEERVARQQALERAQTIETMKLQSDIDQMQRAFAEGRVDDGMKYKAAIEARTGKIEEIKGARAKDVLTLADKKRDDIERTRHNKEMERLQQIQANAAAQRAKYDQENRPSAEDRNILTVMARLNADPDYKKMLDKRNEFSPGDPEFEAIQNYLDEKQRAAYAALKLTPPATLPRLKAPEKPVEEQGAISKFLFGPKLKPSTVKPTAVPFDQLPK